MSNIEDRAKDILKEEIDQLIELQDQGVRIAERKTEIVERMASKLEASGMEPDKICSTIKRILKQNYIEISDWTVEKACGINQKRKVDRYQRRANSEVSSGFESPVTVSSDGNESYTKPDGTEGEREIEKDYAKTDGMEGKRKSDYRTLGMHDEPEEEDESTPFELYEGEHEVPEVRIGELAEIAESATTLNKELQIRLDEALKLADDKDKRIYQLEMQAGEFEVQIGDLLKERDTRKSSSAVNQQQVDRIEELTIERDNLKLTLQEMQEIEKARIKESGFTTASQLPKQVWIPAINAMHFYITLKRAALDATANNDPWRKILFHVATDGQLKAAKLEEDHHQQE